MSDRLFDIDDVPEVPLFREPPPGRGALIMDERIEHDYPPEWTRCRTCEGTGEMPWALLPGALSQFMDWSKPSGVECRDCLGMGSVKAMVRLLAGHRCERCRHPYVPKGDAVMLTAMKRAEILAVFDAEGDNRELQEALAVIDGSLSSSGMHDCETCEGDGRLGHAPFEGAKHDALGFICPPCKGTGKRWTPWSFCDRDCTHSGPLRYLIGDQWHELPKGATSVGYPGGGGMAGVLTPRSFLDNAAIDVAAVEAHWRILTVHHLDGDKANLRWWNLAALCQVCHLHVQGKVVMERVYPHEHSGWFKPHAAGWYAKVYLGEDVSREEALERQLELLALEHTTA